jgi:hypothetical protein
MKGRFENLREDYRKMHECCYQEYVRCVEAGMKNDPKKFFEFAYLLTYLCGTTTNIWLRPVQEDLSMTACLEHSASNL